MTRLEKLLMRIELLDKVTAPANKIMGVMDKLTKQTAVGFANITGGVAGIWGTGLAFQSLTSDYREFHKEVMGVKTLGVADVTLKKLEQSALRFSIRYGESAASFVNSSYDIQSAIAGLKGDELVKFTEAGNILAKGSKADAATITNYMGTMYGIFQQTADKMGRAQWVELLAGQTSMAVDIFKSDGMQMSAAFTSLGADAQAHGIAINEQMAVLGQLQATMSGSEAGTKYKAFLRGVGAAQDKLGLQFTDSAGRMLPVSSILEKLQGKFGAIDTVAKSDLLKKAFGSDEAVATIKLLLNNTHGLNDAITQLGNVRGMDHARLKAEMLADPLDRLTQGAAAVRIGFGALVEKALMPFYHAGIDTFVVLNDWINKYPHFFGLLAKITLVVMGFTAAIAALAIVKGIAIIAMAGFTTGLAILKVAMFPFGPLLKALRLAWVMFNFQLSVGTKIMPAAAIAMRVFGNSMLFSAKAAWGFAVALLANPITWIVVGVVALIAGLWLLVKHWDTVKAATVGAIGWMHEKWLAFRGIIEDNPILKFLFQPLLMAADFVGLLISNLDKIPQWFSNLKSWLLNLNLFDVLLPGASLLVKALDMIPGVDIGPAKVQAASAPTVTKVAEPFTANLPLATSPVTNEDTFSMVERDREALKPKPLTPVNNVPAGGLMQQVNNSRNNSNTKTIGTVNINTTQPVNTNSLRDQLMMVGA